MKILREIIYDDPAERRLLSAAACVFIFWLTWVLFAYKYPPLKFVTSITLVWLLTNEGIGKVVEGLCSGLVSAYLFYLVIDLFPREKARQQKLDALNLLIASILDVYDVPGVFRHEAEIKTANCHLLSSVWLDEQVEVLKNCHAIRQQGSFFLKVKWTGERAERRLADFRHALGLAAAISPAHAIQWLSVTDKLCLLVETLHERLDFSPEDMIPWERGNPHQNPNYSIYMGSLCFRIQEFFEKSIEWLELESPSHMT
ncbi:hypothetical protein [Pseudogulbenkiania ferrooxidans]|uniref:hypothetical protein n=1 Tax=Pseudogulbenkiania ferrooxidans TaxID=549169 RepID=UPI001268222C|nr:hypothetical protein [Pseudogulbenkiania ferrooxidans]